MSCGSQDHFSKIASHYDKTAEKMKISQSVGKAMVEVFDEFMKKGKQHPPQTLELLDFGCGTGTITLLFENKVSKLVGVDPSSAMLGMFDEKRKNSDSESLKTSVELHCINLLDAEKGVDFLKKNEGRFDVVISSMTLHHIPDVQKVSSVLYQLIKKKENDNNGDGSSLLIVSDINKDNESIHFHGKEHLHHIDHPGGFTKEELQPMFEKSGFKLFKHVLVPVERTIPDTGKVGHFHIGIFAFTL